MKLFIKLIASIGIIFLLSSCVQNKGNFLLVNKASEPITIGLVTVCGQTILFKNIQPSKSVSGSYEVKSDSHYDIKIEFKSGKKLGKEIGYVTNGFDFSHEIIVTDIDIDIANNSKKK